jgi:hypothetical protein
VTLVLSLLAEHGQQHDAAPVPEEVRDPPRDPDDVEPQLEQPIAERARRRHRNALPRSANRST